MLFLVLFSLAVYSAVAAYLGWKGPFAFWRPERMRWFLAMGVVWAVAAFELRISKGISAQRAEKKLEPQTAAVAEPVAQTDETTGESSAEESPTLEPPSTVEASTKAQAETDASPELSADELWRQAREMQHNFVPHPIMDHDYLALVHAAAIKGHAEAQAKLAEYASRRNALVEACYWMTKARRKGLEGAEDFLRQCRKQWQENGCLPEYENEYDFFDVRQGVLGRAILRLTCGVEVERATQRLSEMIAAGDVEAGEFLEESKNDFGEGVKTA